MKKILIVSLLFTYINVIQVSALDLPTDIVRALEKGDAKSISKYFNSSVELKLGEIQGVYGKSQAEQILKNFFNTNGVENFKYKHLQHANDKDSAKYYIGELRTSKGITYRVYIYLKDQYIHQMRIDNND